MSGNEWLNKIKYFSYIMNVGKQERLLEKEGLAHKWNDVVNLKKIIIVGLNTFVNNSSKYR